MKQAADQRCLNGWWDYCPVKAPEQEQSVPQNGWSENLYLVPSLVTKSTSGVRKKGEVYYQELLNEDPASLLDGNRKGVFTRERAPKSCARFLRQRWTSSGVCERPATAGQKPRYLKQDRQTTRRKENKDMIAADKWISI